MAFQPMPLSRRPAPFDHPEWVFELKYDGFRSLAVIQNGRCELISRNGHPFNSFDTLRKAMTAPGDGKTVLDGEIVCLDKRGRPQFNDLLFHRGEPCFFAFDLLMSDGRDLRTERLTDRKHELRRLLSKVPASRMRYVEHVEQYGTALFERVCEMDLEGIVAKHSFGNYVTERERTTWFKIKESGLLTERRTREAVRARTPSRTRPGLALLRVGLRGVGGGMNCQIEYVSSDSDIGMPCGKPAVTKCADCGTSICF
jgi:bifunctional non-homologous end joining protein LigD